VALTSLQHLELFAEVAAQHRLGSTGKWFTVALVEFLKALVRLGLLATHGGRMIKNQKVPERAEVICDDNMHLFNAETIAKLQRQSNAANLTKQQEVSDVLLLRDQDDSYSSSPLSTERKKPARETIFRRNYSNNRPPQPSQQNSNQHPASNDRANIGGHKGLTLLGELLYIFRPLIYLGAMYLWGTRSWRAWTLSLAVDVGSWAASSKAQQPGTNPELARRTAQWGYYLVRSPLYEALLASCVLRWIVRFLKRLPFVTTAIDIVKSYVEAYRERYFYISGSDS
jgi:peroxin-16